MRLDDIKPILQPLLEGREDSGSIIEQLQALESADAESVSLVDHEASLASIRAELTDDFNKRMEATFFSASQPIAATPAETVLVEAESAEGTIVEEDLAETITTDDLFKEGN